MPVKVQVGPRKVFNFIQTGMCQHTLVNSPIKNFMIIHSEVHELLHYTQKMDRHGKANWSIFATSQFNDHELNVFKI
jgi:hypothetical protein